MSLLSHKPMKIMPNILHHVGNTPMVRLNRIGKDEGIKCDLCKNIIVSLIVSIVSKFSSYCQRCIT